MVKSQASIMKIVLYVGLIDLYVCFGFYAVSTIFQLFHGDSSQIHVSWTSA